MKAFIQPTNQGSFLVTDYPVINGDFLIDQTLTLLSIASQIGKNEWKISNGDKRKNGDFLKVIASENPIDGLPLISTSLTNHINNEFPFVDVEIDEYKLYGHNQFTNDLVYHFTLNDKNEIEWTPISCSESETNAGKRLNNLIDSLCNLKSNYNISDKETHFHFLRTMLYKISFLQKEVELSTLLNRRFEKKNISPSIRISKMKLDLGTIVSLLEIQNDLKNLNVSQKDAKDLLVSVESKIAKLIDLNDEN